MRLRLLLAGLLLAAALPRPAAAQEPVQMCRNQPVPQGYVVTAIGVTADCPGGAASASYNTLTIRVPGDTVTVCNTLSQMGQGYVVTGQRSLEHCPNYYGGRANATSYRRVSQPPQPSQPQRPGSGPPATNALPLMDQYDRAVFRRLGELEQWLGLDAPTHHPWISRLADEAVARSSMQVEGGYRYTLVAVCDDDCGDLDLRVLDGGYVVGQDVAPDENATVQISPARNGTLTVEVIMGSCAQSPCRYAVAVYETPRPGARPPRRSRP